MSDLILFSGGLDSTVLLYHLIQRDALVALSFLYGQRHKKELLFAKETCSKLEIEHLVIPVDQIYQYVARDSALLNHSQVLPDDHYTHENQKVTVVPGRNLLFLSIATAIAESRGIKDVYYAAHSNDHAIYPDCRPEFVESVSATTSLATDGLVTIHAPFVHKTKADIVLLGASLGVPFEQTWSCYAGGELHCGVCATCQERREAFKIAGVSDPTEYIK